MKGRAYYFTTLGEWRRHAHRFGNSHWVAADLAAGITGSSKILVLIEADEGAHLSLERHPGFEALPHPLSEKSVSASIAENLAAHGVASGATTFDVAEAAAQTHPLLRHRIF
ncbi:MAG: hypothetical protein ACRD4K_01745 [Candidatus Acidiferrales bacterium]